MENTVLGTTNKGYLNRNQIKYIVIIAMLMDHIAWGFVDAVNPSIGACMHFIGRLTGPTMAYFVGEGYSYTRDAGRYQKRLALFALISWPAFVYYEFGSLPVDFGDGSISLNPMQSVIFTLFLGITAIRVWESARMKKTVKIICIILLCMISAIGDWPVMDVLGCLFVHVYRDRPKAKWTAFTLTFFIPNAALMIINAIALRGSAGAFSMWFQMGVLIVPLMLGFLYNGQCGSKAKVHKWFFYLFYPAHLAVLGLIRWCIL